MDGMDAVKSPDRPFCPPCPPRPLPRDACVSRPLHKIRVLVGVGWGAAAQETKFRFRLNGVPGSRGDQNGVSWPDFFRFPIQGHYALALEDEINLLAQFVIMLLGRTPRGKRSFRQALVFDRSIAPIKNAPDGGPILGGKRSLCIQVLNDHKMDSI